MTDLYSIIHNHYGRVKIMVTTSNKAFWLTIDKKDLLAQVIDQSLDITDFTVKKIAGVLYIGRHA